MMQQAATGVSEKAKQGAEACRRGQWWWAEASIWTERMVSALGNGVKGGKWYSLMDKSLPQAKAGVVRPTTLEAAWRNVARNHGAAGVDGQSNGSRRKPSGICQNSSTVLSTAAIGAPG